MTEGVRLRRDAQRNLERLMTAAAEAFRERGLQVPLEEIAQRAGVSAGTLYNRFRNREALIDAVMPALVEAGVRDALARAQAIEDPWEALTVYVTLVCELQADNPALNDAVSRRFADAEALTAMCDAQMEHARGLLERARTAGALRPDCTVEDLMYLFWSTSTIVRATAGVAPRTWRRALAINLDGLRARAVGEPLPEPPLTPAQLHEALLMKGTY
ncbi:TetR/AcrR family transcriptional regulator [Dactylosporangium sp. CS-033363]|uniref:TetR/AcrR family transcriptional regulator n=1 Tax=Dactylosporangium sp. CS-033363 TaxID=3239935 RepID=UPI003D93F56C